MKRSNIFWGLILVLLGLLFLLKQQGIIDDVWGTAFPIGLILAGAMALMHRRDTATAEAAASTVNIPLGNAPRVDLDIDHGAGSFSIDASAADGTALQGNGGAGLTYKSDAAESGLAVELHAGPSFLPFLGPESGQWHFGLTPSVPTTITLEAGAADLRLDLAGLRLSFLRLQAGAARVWVRFPLAAGRTLAEIECGMATLDLLIPAGVAARIRVEQGASTLNLDKARFRPLDNPGNAALYQSDDFDANPNKVELNLKGGANNINISEGTL